MTASPVTMTVDGEERLAADLRGVAGKLDNLDAAAQSAGALIADRARGRAPVVSGALANSLTVDVSGSSVTVASALPYSGPIHYGWSERNITANPFLVSAGADSTALWVAAYADEAQELLDDVKGA